MSDGSLSQDEIDALLQGGGGDFGGAPDQGMGGSGGIDLTAFQNLLNGVVSAQSSNLSSLMGEKTVTIGNPELSSASSDELTGGFPDQIVQITLNFTDAIEGSHSYVMSSEDASSLAGLIVGQDQVEMGDMALEALKEALSTLTGVALNVFGDMAGGTIMPSPAEAQEIDKNSAELPVDGVQAKYTINVEGENPIELYEVFEESIVQQLAGTVSAPQSQPQPQQPPQQQANGGGGMDDLFGGGQPAGGGGGMGQPQQPNYGGGMGGFGGQQQGMMMSGQNPPNVQSVQFPSFNQPQAQHQESGNISLLMDVYMEMTVELGRTKKPIKEILGMGEGTIIELDKLAGEPVDILVNHKLIATGEVVVIDENFGVRVTEIVSPAERMKDLT